MIDGSFVKELQERMRAPVVLADTIVEGPFVAAPGDWKVVDPRALMARGPTPDPLKVYSLTALRDYLVANRDSLSLDQLVVHVVSPQVVRVVGELEARTWSRDTFLEASATVLTDGFLGKYVPQDEFIVALQTRFAESDSRATVLRLVGNIKNESVKTSTDDGVTQTVQTRAGVVLTAEAAVPNPVRLTPYRTFREVTQPESWFVLRVQAGRGVPEIGLFEADGGAWRLTAVERLGDWLRNALPTDVAVLA